MERPEIKRLDDFDIYLTLKYFQQKGRSKVKWWLTCDHFAQEKAVIHDGKLQKQQIESDSDG